MRSMRIDCAPVRIDTWDELVAYMDGSAGSVGRIMAALLGVPARHHADLGRLGLAFQLANFIRDVREDRRLDRVYLPSEDRERFGVCEDDLAADAATPEVRALVAHEVERARGLFAGARPAIASAPASVRPGVRFATGLYRRMLDRVEATASTSSARAGVRVWHIPGAALEAMRWRAPRAGDAARRRAGAARAARADVLICGASFAGLAVARDSRRRGRRARRRPLRDRRARHLGLRGADAVAARDGRRARDPPGDPVHGVPHAARLGPLPAALELVELRLQELCHALWEQTDARFEIAKVQAATATPSSPTAAI